MKGSIFTTHLATRRPDIAIRVYTWQWTLYENRDTHTTLFLEYFLDTLRYKPIKTIALLHHAVCNLNSIINVLFGWKDLLKPVTAALQPSALTTENCIAWTRYIHKILAKCTVAILVDTDHQRTTTTREQNEAIIRDIIKMAMTPAQRAQEPGGFLTGTQDESNTNPIVFTDLAQRVKTDRSSRNTASTPKKSMAQTVTLPRRHQATSPITTLTTGTPPHLPQPLTPICVRAWMNHYKIDFPDGPAFSKVHPENLLSIYPNRYDRIAAQQQVRLYLHDKVELAERITTAMEADNMYFK